MPYFPMVKLIAPRAPIGAAFIIILTIVKSIPVNDFIPFTTGFTLSPSFDMANPNKTDTSSTCRRSPLAKALTMVSGIMFKRKSATVVCCSGFEYCCMALLSSVGGLICMPAPGLITFTTTSPMIRASVVNTSK